MTHERALDSLLHQVGGGGRSLGSPEVDRLAGLVVNEVLREELVSAVLETCDTTWEDGATSGPTSCRCGSVGGGWI